MSTPPHATPVVFVVEDNPITRRMMCLALEADGYAAVEAADGRSAVDLLNRGLPDLMTVDYALGDMNAVDLVRHIRSLPDGSSVPVILITGQLSRLQEHKVDLEGFTDLLEKPVEPSRLVDIVRARTRPAWSRSYAGGGERVLIADDEPVNRKLSEITLSMAGYRVVTASDGVEALRMALEQPPDAILSDVLMPGMDGFQLCAALRREPALERIPVVLVSSAFVEPEDQRLALDIGARALVVRTPAMEEAMSALQAALAMSYQVGDAPTAMPRDYTERLRRQLEKQAAKSRLLSERVAVQSAALSMVGALSRTYSQPQELSLTLGDVLVHCLDATGLSAGLLYLRDADGDLVLRRMTGIPSGIRDHAARAFGHPELLQGHSAIIGPHALRLDSDIDPAGRSFLTGLGQEFALVVPFFIEGRHYGTLVLASTDHDLGEETWARFGETLASQFGQAMALGKAISGLADSEARFRAVVDATYDGLITLSDGIVLEVSPGFETLLGYELQQVRGRTFPELLAPSSRAAARAQLGTAQPGVFEADALHRDGRELPVEVAARSFTMEGREHTVVGLRNMSARKLLERQFQQAQKMEAVGRLAGGVAHDFNNHLMVITGYAEMLHNDLSPGDPRRHDVDEIRNAAEGARSLTRQLLAFSRQQVIEPRVVELEAAVSNVEKMLRRLLGEDVHLVTQPNAQTSNVLIDPGQLEQIIMNMAVNARDAMASGGRFSISTSRVRIDEERARMHGLESAGTYALLTMSDTGIGMDAATMARIFEPFFTTKEVGKGTGLGLATVYGIVKRANGVLQVRSEPGQGATFEVYLPLVEGEVCPLVETTDKLPVGGRETVLLVEDAAPVRAITRRALESFGYSVLEASRGDLALDIARQHCGSIDLLLTDVVMPGMSGRELGEQLRQFCPRTKLLYMSGYTDDSVVRFGVKTAGLAYLEKPFTPDALAHKVRSVLDNEVPSAA